MHPLLKPYDFFYTCSNGVAILSGFQNIPQNISSRIYRCYKLGQSAGSTLRSRSEKPEKAQLGTLENIYVQYDCNRPSTYRYLLRKRSVCQNV